jgi:hypothetical protein
MTIAICIPARDEAAELPGLFAALDRLQLPPACVVHLCLLLDGCRDDSAAMARAYRERSRLRVSITEAAPDAANAGRARHRVMEAGLAALAGEGLLLSTDADSRPAPGWLVAMAAALDQADVVAGRIVRTGAQPSVLQDRIERYYDALFALRRRIDPVPWEAPATHHHGGGANIGVRAATYRGIGGFAPLASGEDGRLLDDAARAGLRVRRDAACVVETSDRRVGRAPGGLAHALQLCDHQSAAATLVARPADAAWQYRHHALARAAYRRADWDMVGQALGVTADHVLGVARDCPNGEAFATRIVPVPPGGMRQVPLPVAEAELAALVPAAVAA